MKKEALDLAGIAGLKIRRRSRETGTLVSVYDAEAAGIDGDPDCAWATVCEEHGSIVGSSTKKLAERAMPGVADWCEPCREAQAKKGASA